MTPRYPGEDEQGRPIVAELGRPETLEEMADRRAASRRAHTANQTLVNLLLAIGFSLVIVVVLVLLVVRPDMSGDGPKVDYVQVAQEAQPTFPEPIAAPALPSGWYANRAEIDDPAGQVESWQIGFVTADKHYLGLVQGVDADPTWLADQVDKQQPTRTASYGGLTWQVYDHRSTGGDVAYALVATSGSSTIVLAGSTATDAEFATVATAIGKDLS